MPPKWEPTSLKRGIPKADVVYAIANATFIDTIEDPGLRGGARRALHRTGARSDRSGVGGPGGTIR